MEKICWANTDNYDDADFVIIGIPDESQSHALRKGTEEAPFRIRQISNLRDTYSRGDKTILGRPFYGTEKKVFDYGNIRREQIEQTYEKISGSRIPITIGGDHSLSSKIINSITKKIGRISLVYFDAHPDFVSSASNYYGSVVNDVLFSIDLESSIEIGIRTPEQEELDNIKKYNMEIITPLDIKDKGVQKVAKHLMEKLGDKVYISFDMDCIDPSYAPGVSVPVPLGLENNDAVYLLQKIAQRGIVGMDIMEVCPSFDVKDRTSHLASRLIGEVLYSTEVTN